MVFAALPTLALEAGQQSRAQWAQGYSYTGEQLLLTPDCPKGLTLLAWQIEPASNNLPADFQQRYEGVLSAADFKYGTDPMPHTYIQIQDAGTYMLRLQVRFEHLSGTDTDFKAENAFLVEVYKDSHETPGMMLLGRGLAAAGGGFVSVTTFFRLKNTDVLKEYVVLAVDHVGDDSHVGKIDYFDLAISKLF